MPKTLPKLKEIVATRQSMGLGFSLGVDGGVSMDNIKILSNIGVDCVGVASAIFSSDDYLGSLRSLYNLVSSF